MNSLLDFIPLIALMLLFSLILFCCGASYARTHENEIKWPETWQQKIEHRLEVIEGKLK